MTSASIQRGGTVVALAALGVAIGATRTHPLPLGRVPVLAVPRSAPSTPRPAPPLIRVCLAAARSQPAVVSATGAYEVRGAAGKVIRRGKQLGATSVRATDRGLTWGDEATGEKQLTISLPQDGLLWFEDHGYRGQLRISHVGPRKLVVVNHVPLEAYVASVVDSEMPLEFGHAARQAQAVAARTFAIVQQQGAPAAALYDLHDSTRSQKYNGAEYKAGGRRLAGESAEGRRAATDTAGLICVAEGRPLSTYYSAICGGHTQAGRAWFDDAASLRGVPCRGCRAAPNCDWTTDVPRNDLVAPLRQLARARDPQFGELRQIQAVDSPAGAPSQFVVRDGVRSVSLTGIDLRKTLGAQRLPSARCTVEPTRAGWRFRGSGRGHGVGLCQWGARGLSREGRDFRQILAHYYPGAKLAPWKPPAKLAATGR